MYIFEIAFHNKLGRELDRKSLCVYGQGQIPNGKMDIKVVDGVAGWRGIADAHGCIIRPCPSENGESFRNIAKCLFSIVE